MKWLYILSAFSILGLLSNKAVYVLSRLYEGAFFYKQYGYFGLGDPNWMQRATYGEKIICKKGDYSPEMEEYLLGKEPVSTWLFSDRKGMKTFWISIQGEQYLVKRHVQRGMVKNLMQMGKCASIWNNLHWALAKGVPVVEPVAFSEKRRAGKVETVVVYRFEGSTSDHFPKSGMKQRTPKITDNLRKKHVVHADLRRRNIICTNDEEEIKLIDVQLMHYYPKYSYVCNKRLNKEARWLRKDYKRLAD